MPRKPDPESIDDENPEADEEWFRQARPAAEVLPEIFGAEVAAEMLRPKRGRPRSATPKQHVNIRLDADVVRAFKSTGKGWQTRMNDALRDWLSTHAPVG